MKQTHKDDRIARRPMDDARLKMGGLSPAEMDLETIFRQICQIAAETVKVERVGVWLFVHDGSELRCTTLYERTRRAYSAGATLQVADFPVYFRNLRVRKTIPAENAACDPRTNELLEAYLEPLGIAAMLDAPVFLDGELIGVVCHEHVAEGREWTTEERDFAGSVADAVAIKIKSAEITEANRLRKLDAEHQAAFRHRDSVANLAAGIAHDFRNLLAVIIASVTEIRAAEPSRSEVVEPSDAALDAAQRGSALATQLLDLASEHKNHPQVLEPAEQIRRLLPVLRRTAGGRHSVEFSCENHIGRVFVDPTQFDRILLNLVANARDAMSNGGKIQLSLEEKTGIPAVGNSNMIVLEVRDDGCGIDRNLSTQIFEPFFTTKSRKGGSGLGLAIVKHVVERAGGYIEAENVAPQGTAFRVFLPRVAS
jgi:signal transduction histidine kinase